MIKAEFDGLTQENLVRDFTAKELEEWDSIEQEAKIKAEIETETQAKRAAAEAKLAALGLTADDLKALGL